MNFSRRLHGDHLGSIKQAEVSYQLFKCPCVCGQLRYRFVCVCVCSLCSLEVSLCVCVVRSCVLVSQLNFFDMVFDLCLKIGCRWNRASGLHLSARKEIDATCSKIRLRKGKETDEEKNPSDR